MGGWIQYSFGPTVGCWLAQHFYLHWAYTRDEKFLREKAYPWLKDIATYLDEISVKDNSGKRKLPISSSPEINDNSIQAWFSQTTNYDLSFIRWTFEKAAELASVLGKTEESGKWKTILSEWPDFALDKEGGLAFAPGYPYQESHRHFSHLVGWHPLFEEESWITPTIFIGPGIAKAHKLSYFEHTDIAPTIAGLTNVENYKTNGGSGRFVKEILAINPSETYASKEYVKIFNRQIKEYNLLRAKMIVASEKDASFANMVALLENETFIQPFYTQDRVTEWHLAGDMDKRARRGADFGLDGVFAVQAETEFVQFWLVLANQPGQGDGGLDVRQGVVGLVVQQTIGGGQMFQFETGSAVVV